MANYTLQLLHMSDGEGSILTPSTAPIMGALIDRFDDFANTLVLAGGDNYIPGPFLNGGADPSVNGVVGGTTALGRPDIAIYNAFGVRASALGNHEWDLGSSVFNGAYAAAAGWVGAQFPYLAADLDFSGDSFIRGTVVAGGQDVAAVKGKVAPSAVVTVGGERIGLVGATTQVLERISSPTGTEVNGFPKAGQAGDNLTEIDDMDLLARQLQPVIDALRAQGINKIVLQSHLQLIENELSLATKLHGVDIILAAGSHTRMGDATDVAGAFPGHDANFALTYPQSRTDLDGRTTLIVSTDSESTYLGRLTVTFDANGEIVPFSSTTVVDATRSGAYASNQATLNAVYGADIGQAFTAGSIGQKVRTITGAVNTVVQTKDGSVYGYTNVYLEGDRVFGRSEETNLGDISADANTAALQAIDPTRTLVVSLKNGGGIRASIGSVSDGSNNTAAGLKLPPVANPAAGKAEGGISQLDSENALRFDNKLMVFDTTPQGLLNILNYGTGLAAGNGGYPQLGGVRVSYDPDNAAGQKVQNVALYDDEEHLLAVVVKNGVVVADPALTISVVTLNFTANGGDGYPIKANGSDFRYLLQDGSLSAAIDESVDFTTVTPANALGELKAFQDYVRAEFPTKDQAFNIPDTPVSLDLRIENLNLRGDAVFQDLFGNLVRDASSPEGRVYTFYDAFLGRAPDLQGAANWVEALEDGATPSEVVSRFLHSTEYVARFGNPDALSTSAYVDQLYSNVLGRAAEADGKANWVNAITNGLSRADVALAFATSPEEAARTKGVLAVGAFIPDQDAVEAARLYYGILDRAPDAGGLVAFTHLIETGVGLQTAASSMLASVEYTTKFGSLSDAGFVEHLYDGALGRSASDPGAVYWIDALQSGAARADIAVGISESAEAQSHLLAVIEAGYHLA